MKNIKRNILISICIAILIIPFGSAVNPDMVTYYKGLGQDTNIVETNDLLKSADDWRDNIIPSGFSLPITTDELLTLADEWRVAPSPTVTLTPSSTVTQTPLPTATHIPTSLKTGTVLKRTLAKGSGGLEIDNKVYSDTMMTLTSPTDLQTALLKVYIRAADKYTISDIPDGTYVLSYMSGTDWNSATNKFNTIDEISRFDDSLTYGQNANYWIATLYPVADGNAPTTSIPESEFPN